MWTLVPALTLLGRGGVFNGGYGLDVPDLMQYMAFIRDSGQHVLSSNLFDTRPDPHLFLDPVFAISGLAWKLGASIQFALLMWVPVAAAGLAVGFTAYARRLLGPDRAAVALGLGLAFFYLPPAMALADWLNWSSTLRFGTRVVGLEMFAGGYAWAGGPALALAAMPLFLLATERLLEPSRRAPGRSATWYAAWAGIAGLFTTWVHPWQGITLLVILAALAAWGRLRRRYQPLVVPAILTAAPLGYYLALSRTHSSWMMASHPNDFAHFGWWLWLGLATVVLALPGFAVSRPDLQERMLLLWPPAAFVVYLSLDRTWFYHALAGLSLPLAILAVRGWRRLALSRALAAGAVLAVTVPGTVWTVQQVIKARAQQFFATGEARALGYLDATRQRGSVLASAMPLGQAVPAFTGRHTFVGHYYWTPDYAQRAAETDALFAGRLSQARAVGLVRVSRARFLVSDCKHSGVDLRRMLGSMVVSSRRFGCAAVYEVRPPGFHAQVVPPSTPRAERSVAYPAPRSAPSTVRSGSGSAA